MSGLGIDRGETGVAKKKIPVDSVKEAIYCTVLVSASVTGLNPAEQKEEVEELSKIECRWNR